MVKGKAMPRPGDRKEGEQQKELSGAPGEARTPDPQIKSLLLFQLSYERIFLFIFYIYYNKFF